MRGKAFDLTESMSAAEHARNVLRRSPYPARKAEFFLYEEMGRLAIDHAGSTSVAGGKNLYRLNPHPLYALKKDGNPRGARSPWREARRVKAYGLDP